MRTVSPEFFDQPQVFVSYARKDAAAASAIADVLEAAGASVWFDRFLPGQDFYEQISHAIARSQVVLVMCSPHSFESYHVQDQVLLACKYDLPLLAVWLTAPVEIPERFRDALASAKWLDAHSGTLEPWFRQLLYALVDMGIEIKFRSEQPEQEARGSASRWDPERRPGSRFKPGDRPIAGSDCALDTLLGTGGLGEAWRAYYPHSQCQPPVVLKFCLDPDAHLRDLLRLEADLELRAQKQIRSDGIVPLLHAYLNNEPPCLEYTYIEGGTLARLLDECRQSPAGSFTPAQVERIVLQIDRIVGLAHRAVPKLVHRDLKPSNVLVERLPERKIKLRVTDFGIGGLSAQPVLERSRSSSFEGELSVALRGAYFPLYASPQRMKGERPDPRDDVYSLGVIWHQLLIGDLTSPAPSGRRWGDALRERGMSAAALDLLSSCLEGNPTHRPDDVGTLAVSLRALGPSSATKPAGGTTDLPLEAPASSPTRERSRAPLIEVASLSEPPSRLGEANPEGEVPSEPTSHFSEANREGKAPGDPIPRPAGTGPRPPGTPGSPFVQTKVFVSHSTSDRDFIEREIIPVLTAHGINTWYSKDDIQPAAPWERAIQQGLIACESFMIVMSQNSAQSDNVRDEVSWAIDNRPGKIIPVLLQDCNARDFHIRMARIQHVDYRTDWPAARQRLLAVWGRELIASGREGQSTS
jgi:serine/threonine protein kinase